MLGVTFSNRTLEVKMTSQLRDSDLRNTVQEEMNRINLHSLPFGQERDALKVVCLALMIRALWRCSRTP